MVEEVCLEACSICRLCCPCCQDQRNKRDAVIGKGWLRFSDFKAFLENHPNIRHIELSNWGEIFLNPELKAILELAAERQVTLAAANGVHFNDCPEEILEAMVRTGFRFLTVSLDGASEAVYAIYRRGGNFNRVIRNIEKINALKEKYHSAFPGLRWQFILFGHNEHEIPAARKMARKLKMQFRIKLNAMPDYSPVRNAEWVLRETGLPAVSRPEFEQKKGHAYAIVCRQFWTHPQINWDGKLLGCCKNIWGDFGNVFEKGLTECLESEAYTYAKEMLLGNKAPREDIPCSRCPDFIKIQRDLPASNPPPENSKKVNLSPRIMSG